jgi:phospholipid/cholesterol/gamma-HCH transport system permease protein
VPLLGIPSAHFIYRLEQMVDPDDVIGGIFKAGVFGFLLTSISCFQGMRASGGARGVGLATTRAVVFSSVTILVVDFFLTQLILETIQK